MKNGIEIRENGNIIIAKCVKCVGDFKMYYVLLRHGKGRFIDSKNGPWDYLNNARQDADQNGRIPF